MKKLKMIATLSIAAALTACGGGGGDDESNNNVSAEGFWGNTDAAILITNTGELWGVELVNSSLALYKGNVTTNGSSLSAQLSAYWGGQKINGTATGTIVPQQTLKGTISASGQSSSFSLGYDNTYNQSPNLPALTGTYKESDGGTFTVAANGVFSGTTSGGCSESGTLTPDASGKNFYRVSLTIGQETACGSLAGQTATGVLAVANSNRLVGGVVLGDIGDAFFLSKQ